MEEENCLPPSNHRSGHPNGTKRPVFREPGTKKGHFALHQKQLGSLLISRGGNKRDLPKLENIEEKNGLFPDRTAEQKAQKHVWVGGKRIGLIWATMALLSRLYPS